MVTDLMTEGVRTRKKVKLRSLGTWTQVASLGCSTCAEPPCRVEAEKMLGLTLYSKSEMSMGHHTAVPGEAGYRECGAQGRDGGKGIRSRGSKGCWMRRECG